MFEAINNQYRIDQDSDFKVSEAITIEDESLLSKKKLKDELKDLTKELGELQHQLYAEDRRSILCVFQAMDAAGKDSTIRAVFNRVNPTGCHVSSFKKPSSLELDHDFLWRSTTRLPERGQIGIFNQKNRFLSRMQVQNLFQNQCNGVIDNTHSFIVFEFFFSRYKLAKLAIIIPKVNYLHLIHRYLKMGYLSMDLLE